MVTELERQAIVDEEHLRVLSITYWVWGGLVAIYALFMAAYFAFIGSLFWSFGDGADAPPREALWILFGVATFVLLVAGTLATLQILTGFWIRNRRHRVASMVVAGFTCLSIPVGTLLGVFTFVVLSRRSVSALYALPAPHVTQAVSEPDDVAPDEPAHDAGPSI